MCKALAAIAAQGLSVTPVTVPGSASTTTCAMSGHTGTIELQRSKTFMGSRNSAPDLPGPKLLG